MVHYREYAYSSAAGEQVRAVLWLPEAAPRSVLQLCHGMREHIGRYDRFARYMAQRGVLVVGNDHPGHGKGFDSPEDYALLGEENGWQTAVENMHSLYERIRRLYPELPYFLLGHSEGTFLARAYAIKHPGALSGLILSAPFDRSDTLCRLQLSLARGIIRRGGVRWRSGLLDRMAFGACNRLTARRTDYDWLSRDDSVVDAYAADEKCGGMIPAGLFRDILEAARFCHNKENAAAMGKTLPLLLIAGEDDHATGCGKGLGKVASFFRSVGTAHPALKLYPGGRHEMLQETNRLEVWGDVLTWLQLQLPEEAFTAQEDAQEAPAAAEEPETPEAEPAAEEE